MDMSLDFFMDKVHKSQQNIPEEFLSKIAYIVLQAICYMKSKQLIHRDIKPSNILINKDGTLKVCDFGVTGRLIGSVNTSVKGTRLYMAVKIDVNNVKTIYFLYLTVIYFQKYKQPEKFEPPESGITVTSDVWSLGISLV